MTGASAEDELDGLLFRVEAIKRRYFYQTNSSCRNSINNGEIEYSDLYLSELGQQVKYVFCTSWFSADIIKR